MVMSERAFVLIVDGESADGQAIAKAVGRSGHVCKVVDGAAEAVLSVRQRPPDVVIAGYPPQGQSNGVDLLRQTKEQSPDAEVILISGSDTPSPKTMAGAFECIARPIDIDALRTMVDRAAHQAIMARQNRLMREQAEKAFNFGGIIGASESLAKELKRVRKVAPTKSTVLIVGESGTGKELIAEAIHVNSPRSGKPFKVINCAALSDTLIESELFGHVKGAFTGAVSDRKGILEAADGGTLFLDEIGDTPPAMQAKLLRALENGEVMRVGTNEVRHVDIRFVAATHHNLWERVEAEKFREDLFFRLHAHSAIRIPPLRERREDIPLLIHHFIDWANREYQREVTGITPEAVRKLTNHSWRGNVRELKHAIERMVVETEGDTLDVEDLPENVRDSTDIVPVAMPNMSGLSMADVERLHILGTLKLTGGNRERAAAILKIGARTLYRKLKEYGIT